MPASYSLLKKTPSVNKHFIHNLLLCGLLIFAPNSGVVGWSICSPPAGNLIKVSSTDLKKNTAIANVLSLYSLISVFQIEKTADR